MRARGERDLRRRGIVDRAGVATAFLDRDGTINRKAPEGEYVTSWAEFQFLPGAVEAVALLHNQGVRVIVVTNQRGVALGRMGTAALEDIHARMRAELAARGGVLDGIYACPHDLDMCDCRKPGIALFERAVRDFPGLELCRSAVIGDSDSDMRAAARIGAVSIRVGVAAPGAGSINAEDVRVDCQVASLWEAASWLVDG